MNGDENIGRTSSANWGSVPSPSEVSTWRPANFFATGSPFLARDSYELMNLTEEESGSVRMLEWRPGSSDQTIKARLLRAGRACVFDSEALLPRTVRGRNTRRPMLRGSTWDRPIQLKSRGRNRQSPSGLQCTSGEIRKERDG